MNDLGFPEKPSPSHDLAEFDSGEPSLDEWLRKRAAQNEAAGASRTYVVPAGKKVAGYYCLAVGAAAHSTSPGSPGRIWRNMPDPVPVMILARLAVARVFQGHGVGAGMLRDAVLRTVQAAEIAGIRAMLVHAISPEAKRFYERYGFIPSPPHLAKLDPLMLMITVAEAAKIAGGM